MIISDERFQKYELGQTWQQLYAYPKKISGSIKKVSKIALILIILATQLRLEGGREHANYTFCFFLPIDVIHAYKKWSKLAQPLQKKVENVQYQGRTHNNR